MGKNEVITKIAAILTTLLETGGSPESMLYIFCDMDMDKWNYLRGVMIRGEWVNIKGNFVTLSPGGVVMAERLNAAIGKS